VDPPDPPVDLADALHRVRSRGGRLTPAKRALIELLHIEGDPLTADQIAERLTGHDRSVVYRNLNQLEQLGIAEHLHPGHGQAVYRAAGHPKLIVACTHCGTERPIDRADTRAFVNRIHRHTGITPDLTHFPLTGTCDSCAAARSR
jgi:Fur family ferric uptake transcriptional regulator